MKKKKHTPARSAGMVVVKSNTSVNEKRVN
jgi:hypothetical protein